MILQDELIKNTVVDPTTLCWEWCGVRFKSGYGRFKKDYSHRVSYRCFIGGIQKGFCVCHKCDNPPCINPEHLFMGTRKDNSQDCLLKGRFTSLKGEKSSSARLKKRDILNILKETKEGKTQSELSKKYKVHYSLISLILNGKRWNVVTGLPNRRKRNLHSLVV